MFKNLDKCGLAKDLEGRLTFTNRVNSPKVPEAAKSVVATKPQVLEQPEERSGAKKSKERTKVQAGLVGPGIMGNAHNTGIQGMAISSATPYYPILYGIIDENDWQVKYRIYKDIYRYDLAGAVVDLISELPFSDYNLVGINDPEIVDTYLNSIENLHMPSLLPSLTRDYLVMGAFCGSLNWDENTNRFKSIVSHSVEDLDITDLGMFGADPIIDLNIPEQYQEILSRKQDERCQRLLKHMPEYLRAGISSGVIELNPISTLYIPRRGLSTSNEGNSYFNRILTIHLLEKALIKGTIESAQRRQRPIMHVAAGTDDWEPQPEQLSDILSSFQAADLDPISGIVVTRNGVTISDIKNPNDLWSWQDVFEFSVNAKMRAMGVNETILSGEASWNTLDAALSSFMDSISTTRDYITRAVFYDKLFPIIAYKNDFKIKKTSTSVLSSTSNDQLDLSMYNGRIKQNRKGQILGTSNFPTTSIMEIEDVQQYAMPTIQWNKQLKPEVDKEYMDILDRLMEKNVPISLRMLAAAGGENIDDLINGMDDDNDLRLQIAEKKKELVDDAIKDKTAKFLGIEEIDQMIPAPQIDEGDVFAKLKTFAAVNHGVVDQQQKARELEKVDAVYGVRSYDKNGKRRILTPAMKQQITEKIHKQTASVLAEKAKIQNQAFK